MKRYITCFTIVLMLLATFPFNTLASEKAERIVRVLIGGGSVAKSLQPVVDEFNIKNEGNIKVIVTATSNPEEKMMMQFITKDAYFDIVPIQLSWARGFNQYMAPLNGLIHEHDVDVSGFGNLVDYFVDDHDQVKALPFRFGMGLITYRKDVFEKHDIDPIIATSSWENIRDTARRLTRKDADGNIEMYGIAILAKDVWRAVDAINEIYVNPGGAWLNDDNSGPSPILKSEYAEKQFELLKSMVEEGLTPNPVGMYTEELFQGMRNGKFAMSMTTFSGLVPDLEVQGSLSKGKLGYAPLPSQQKGPLSVSNWAGVWALGIDANSKNKEASFQFLKFATGYDGQKISALEGSNGPALLTVYDDPDYTQIFPAGDAIRRGIEENLIPELPQVEGSIELGNTIMEEVHRFLLDSGYSGKKFGDRLYDIIQNHINVQ